MFTIWINDVCVETIPVDFLLAVEISKKLSSRFPGEVITVRENGVVLFKKWLPVLSDAC